MCRNLESNTKNIGLLLFSHIVNISKNKIGEGIESVSLQPSSTSINTMFFCESLAVYMHTVTAIWPNAFIVQ